MPDIHELPLRKFVAPEIIYGAGALARVGRTAANFGARKLLLVAECCPRWGAPSWRSG